MWRRIGKGMQASLPIAVGCMPFGVAYGTVAVQSMPAWQASLMSLVVFAGTAQFITASLLAQGGPYLPILITGLLINMRHMLMSADLSRHVRSAPRLMYVPMAHLVTDEAFAVSMAHFERNPGDPLFFLGAGMSMYLCWQVATLAGINFGARLPEGLGLDYALPASLICLLFLLLRDRRSVAVAGLSAALAIVSLPFVSSTWSTMVATLIAATVGVGWKRWRSRS